MIAASVIAAYSGRFGPVGDDWSRFDHQTLRVAGVASGESLQLMRPDGTIETIKLLGIASPDRAAGDWLTKQVTGQNVTLLLQFPQTRDASRRLLAFAFIKHRNLSVELVKAGLAYAQRRETSIMDGFIRSAEAEARKKQRGIWAVGTQ